MHQLSEALRDEWAAAVEDAGMAADQVDLFAVDRPRPASANLAEHSPPRRYVKPSDLFGYHECEVANRLDNRGKHRVAIWKPRQPTSTDVALFGALLRHELEHARQWDACGSIVGSLDFVISHELGARFPTGIPGWAYQAKPLEQDANAAGRLFLLRRHSANAQRVFLLPEGRAFQDAPTSLGDLATLPLRMAIHLEELVNGNPSPMTVAAVRYSDDRKAIVELLALARQQGSIKG